MKKLTAIIAAFLFVTSVSAFTMPEENIKEKIVLALHEDFDPTTAISWQFENNHYIATFHEKTTRMVAAYTEEGTLQAVARYINYSVLPTATRLAVEKRFKGATISDNVIELNSDGATSYFVTVVTAKKILKVKVTASGQTSIEERKNL